ncbi:coiled-coil domain-containing protein 157 isoform X1 [Python bivittatus]|uniref:Coiled-coil domain-containing protein 157 isoform X1 n=2 Tax=Python bivittatus TaxID=176946 RepID=A0A9F2R693_PYTBI|nr:coiled-coil domain-containing protein 157 isoform X1 [Python bivittatus]XP_025028627.1 coiled-coil domain-containing protein 157 isoform X1 [Python bivittatus]
MVSLLINRNCMESLRKDITDLQGTVISVFSHAGAVRFPSWKFPDKMSCDLDLVALMEYYDFVENDPEFTQHSHVVLLELVIDRLLLLLQSFTGYTEGLISKEAVPPSRAVGPSMSVGLAVRKSWNSMLKLGALYQQLADEKQYTKDNASSLKCSFQATKAENERVKSGSPESDLTLRSFQSSPLTYSTSSRLLDHALSACSDHKSAYDALLPARSVHSQTIESSLVPCDACESTQVSLQEVGKSIIAICNTLNIPSSLGKFLRLVQESLGSKLLTATDVSYWATEQSKDLSRINKHIQMVMGLINPLKGELEESEKQKDELKKQLENLDSCLQKEKDAKREEIKLVLQKKEREGQQLVAELQRAKEDVEKRAVSLEKNLSNLKEKLQAQEATIQELEQARSDLQQEMKSKMVAKSEVEKREEQLEILTSQLQRAEQQLNGTAVELNKERARGESMLQHKESLQAKQRTLMQQLDSLDQECEQLKTSLADGEDDRQMMRERLKEVQEEKWEIQGRLEAQKKLTEKLKQEKLSLEQSMSELKRTISELGKLIHEMKEKEKLLVFFPDLHVPVETQFETTGDVTEDMGKQLQANNIRISILEEENSRLRGAITKMKESAQKEAQKFVLPIQLWIRSAEKTGHQDSEMHPPMGYPGGTSFQGQASRPPTNSSTTGSAARSRSRNSPAICKDGPVSHRTSSNKLPKPPLGDTTREAAFKFSYKEAGGNSYSRGKERGRNPPPPGYCTRNHQK